MEEKRKRVHRRGFADFNLAEALKLLKLDTLTPWRLTPTPLPPTPLLEQHLQRVQETFAIRSSEAGRVMIADALLTEIGVRHTPLRIWKEASLSTDTLTGFADYMVAPRRDYLETPLLCAVEAKKDDFEQGTAQCLAELSACRWNNQQAGKECDVYGIVTNGNTWQFYRYTLAGEVFETPPYSITDLPGLLGVLDHIFAACEAAL
jgi:hypothetical protein